MADEKKKPWQFSLGRALSAMTMICVTLALAGALFREDIVIIDEILVLIGFGSAIGVFLGGGAGAALVEMVIIIICVEFLFLWSLGNMIESIIF